MLLAFANQQQTCQLAVSKSIPPFRVYNLIRMDRSVCVFYVSVEKVDGALYGRGEGA